jgi:hypothetical protein
MLALGESDTGEGLQVLIGRSLNPDQSPAEEPYSMTNAWGSTTTGGLAGWSMRGTRLSMQLTPDAAAELALSQSLVFDLPDLETADRVGRAITWLLTPSRQVPDMFATVP